METLTPVPSAASAELEGYLKEFRNMMAEKASYRTACTLLEYDLETVAPAKGQQAEIEALALLSLREKECITSDRTEKLLKFLRTQKLDDPGIQKSCDLLWKAHIEQKKIPNEFTEEFVKAKATSEKAWENAKLTDNFAAFAPHLEKVIDLTRRECAYIDPNRDPYEILIDRFERGMDLPTIDRVFDQVKQGIMPILEKIMQAEHYDVSRLDGNYPIENQKAACRYLLNYIGFDLDAGAMGESLHPFTTRIGFSNIRVTDCYHVHECINPMFSIIHEGGHGIFEQSIDPCFKNTQVELVDNQMGLHESQSRFYENILARSKAFWQPIYGDIQEFLPDLKRFSLEDFERAINDVKPSHIRTDADELTYCLHIILRYEMELAIFHDKVPVKDLPDLWCEKSKALLGIVPATNAEGILQDMHWSDASFGYFPSYLLGSVYDGMLLEAMENDLGSVESLLAAGQIRKCTSWLQEKIHRFGTYYTSAQVLERVCKKELSADALIRYYKKKYSRIYHI